MLWKCWICGENAFVKIGADVDGPLSIIFTFNAEGTVTAVCNLYFTEEKIQNLTGFAFSRLFCQVSPEKY